MPAESKLGWWHAGRNFFEIQLPGWRNTEPYWSDHLMVKTDGENMFLNVVFASLQELYL